MKNIILLTLPNLIPSPKTNPDFELAKLAYGAANTCIATKDGEDTYKVSFPKGSYKPSGKIRGGVGWYAVPKFLPGLSRDNSERVCLEYKAWFDDDFDFVKGGKLPGLYLGSMGATGGNHIDSGATFRVMWRASGAAEAYVYAPKDQVPGFAKLPGLDINTVYGTSIFRGEFFFKKNQWNTVKISVKLNTINKADGVLSITINDVTRDFSSMTWRTQDIGVSGVIFESFFGGSSPDWATPKDTFILFKDIVCSHDTDATTPPIASPPSTSKPSTSKPSKPKQEKKKKTKKSKKTKVTKPVDSKTPATGSKTPATGTKTPATGSKETGTKTPATGSKSDSKT